VYDKDKIIIGIIIFLCLLTFPIWYLLCSGEVESKADPKVEIEETQCIESAQYMREHHMRMLADWKNLVVRENIRTYKASDGEVYQISLTETCMECHSNKEQFCDECHGYVGLEPYCWQCHNVPEGEK
jgi:hypothetical protein